MGEYPLYKTGIQFSQKKENSDKTFVFLPFLLFTSLFFSEFFILFFILIVSLRIWILLNLHLAPSLPFEAVAFCPFPAIVRATHHTFLFSFSGFLPSEKQSFFFGYFCLFWGKTLQSTEMEQLLPNPECFPQVIFLHQNIIKGNEKKKSQGV